MCYIVSLLFIILGAFVIYKLCVYLNDNGDVKKKKINNIIFKVFLSSLFIWLILLLYNGIDGYINGYENIYCTSATFGDCYDYGMKGFFQSVIYKFYWTIPLMILFLLYIIIYKVKYKEKIIKNKLLYFIIIIIVTLVLFLPLYKTIFNRLYFLFNDYKYEVVVKGFDYNDYYIHIYDKRINVIKKENEVCFDDSCDPVYNGEYEIYFTEKYMNDIYGYVNNLFENKNFNSTTIVFDDVLEGSELNIIKSIMFNDEKYMEYIKDLYDYKIITNTRFLTLQNDGGSNLNVYYQIYLNENKVIKYEDYYIGFKGYEYRGKVIYKKDINNGNDLKLIIEDLISKEDINDNNNYSPYVIEFNGEKKEIYNSQSMELLKEILVLFDKQ